MPKIHFITNPGQGGYATDIPSERMDQNMGLRIDNLVWKEGLVSRGGTTVYSTLTTSVSAVRGFFRAYQNSLWYDLAAIDTSTGVHIWKATGTTWSLYSTDGVTLQTGYDVEMDQLGDEVVAVNGYDRPYCLHYSTYSSRFVMEYLDKYDTREISTADWKAGARYTTGTTEYVDMTSECHNLTTGDFPITPTTQTSDGHYIASDYPFTYVTYSSAMLLSTHAVAAYHYWTTASGWTVMTSLLETAPTWTTSIGDRTVQLPYLADWAPLDSTAYSTLLDYKYVMRVTFPTAPSTVGYCRSVAINDVHYLTRIMADERPNLVKVHQDHMYLASGNNIQYSPLNSVKNWDELYVDYFNDGGPAIIAMVSMQDYLLLLKPDALYGFFTNDWTNLTKRKLSVIGTPYKRSVAVIGQLVMFLANDGVRLWNGVENILVSKHIQSDINSATKTGAAAVAYKGFYYLAFPGSNYILVCDPDTFRRDDLGDGRVSWFKYTGVKAYIWNYHSGANDNGYLLAAVNSTAPNITQFETTGFEDNGSLTFTKTFKTGYWTAAEDRIIRRIRPEIGGAGVWGFTLSAGHGLSSVTTDVTFLTTVTPAFRFWTTICLPYTMDGRSFALSIQMGDRVNAKIYSIAYDVAVRRF